MNNSRLSFVILIAAVAGIVLGGVALSTGLAGKKALEELKARVESDAAQNAQVRDEVRTVASRTQDGLDEMARQMVALRDQMTNAVARAVAAATTKPAEPRKEDAAKDKKEVAGAKKAEGGAVPAPAGKGTYHTVQSGDLLGRLAKQYGTTADAIEKLNPGINPGKLKLGQKIRVK